MICNDKERTKYPTSSVNLLSLPHFAIYTYSLEFGEREALISVDLIKLVVPA
jgi:hypothetical protein